MSALSRRARLDCALIVLTIAAGLAAALPIGAVRAPLVLAAALIVPGAALVTLLHIDEPLFAAAVAIALSIAIDIIGSLALVWSEFWHPGVLAIVLGTGSVGLLLTDVNRRPTGRGAPAGAPAGA